MIDELQDCEPLSQVWFVHDYIQLQFQEKTVTILNRPTLSMVTGEELHRSASGFCDALVALIGQCLSDAILNEGGTFRLDFQDGTRLTVPLTGKDATGPEGAEVGCSVIFNA